MPMPTTKKELLITITSEGTAGRISLIGSISEWNANNAEDFRMRCQELKDAGVKALHVYMMTMGGDVFQANEIYNILIEFFGEYTVEGGAVVASAGTYLGVKAKSWESAKNGQVMIHKPSGGSWGNETELENYLKLLKNMTSTYYDAYVAKLSTKFTEADFKAKWDAGDFWMTAAEAKEWGFVDSIKEPVKVDQATAQYIKACGSPIEMTIDINQNPNDVDLKIMAKSVGLPESATEDQITARITENAEKAGKYDTLKAQVELQAKTKKEADIKATLDKCEKTKVIKADARSKWAEMLEKDFEGTKALLDGMEPVSKLSDDIVVPSGSGAGTTYQGKTFEQLQDENPETLAKLQDENPTAFEQLFADYKTRHNLK